MESFWRQDGNKIYQEHVLYVLKEMPTGSVQVVCTSPPYWGLRDYNLPPQIWDFIPYNCYTCPKHEKGPCDVCHCNGTEHEWGDKSKTHSQTSHSGIAKFTEEYDGNKRNAENWATMNDSKAFSSQGQFCIHCSAWKGSLGLEPTPELYISHMVQVFSEVRRVLRDDGTLWLNMGDSYAGGGRAGYSGNAYGGLEAKRKKTADHIYGPPTGKLNGYKPKDLIGMPWRVAFALQAEGWYLRSAMPWVKRSAMPESATDRPASALEYMFLFSKSQKYFFDMESIKIKSAGQNGMAANFARGTKEQVIPNQMDTQHRLDRKPTQDSGSRNFRNTDLYYQSISPPHGAIFYGDEMVGLDINPQAMKEAHFATFPEKLIEPCILSGTSERGACPECLAPWERVVEKTNPNKQPIGGKLEAVKNTGYRNDGNTRMGDPESKTIGWKPGCSHYPQTLDWMEYITPKDKENPAEWEIEENYIISKIRLKLLDLWKPLSVIPCTVLDPFGGSCTTAIVSHKHNRKFVMIDLSETYLKDIAIPRIEKETRQLKLFQ